MLVLVAWPEPVECYNWLFSVVICWPLEEFVCILVVLHVVDTKQEKKKLTNACFNTPH